MQKYIDLYAKLQLSKKKNLSPVVVQEYDYDPSQSKVVSLNDEL